MADLNCSACEDLKQNSYDFVANGVTDEVCASLKNDSGFSPKNNHDDCTDLDLANDCLIGNMEEEVDKYEYCDWQDFAKLFIGNLYTMLKSFICSMCGIWTNIHNLWTVVNRHECEIQQLYEGTEFSFDEYTDTGKSYIVAGKGVSFANVAASGTAEDVTLEYVAGGISVLTGSCKFYNANFTDRVSVAHFDNDGVDPTTGTARKGNDVWETNGYIGAGGELVYELRILKSEYPQLEKFWTSGTFQSAGGAYIGRINFINEGQYASGQHGWCDKSNGNPMTVTSSRGHLVPAGWMYLQVRLQWLGAFNATAEGAQYSPFGIVPVRMSREHAEC